MHRSAWQQLRLGLGLMFGMRTSYLRAVAVLAGEVLQAAAPVQRGRPGQGLCSQ